MSDADLLEMENVACPGAGACGGQYTANTMSTVMEMIGLSPMGFNSVPAMDPQKDQISHDCGKLVLNLLRHGITPKDILTRPAFENAIAGVAATGGSTNAVLHLLAIAREAGVALAIDDKRHSGFARNCRSEEHTSELQSHSELVCGLLLEQKKYNPERPLQSALCARLAHDGGWAS